MQLGTHGFKELVPTVCEVFDTLGLVPFLVDTCDEADGWALPGGRDRAVRQRCLRRRHSERMRPGHVHPDGVVDPVRSLVDLFVAKNGLATQCVLAPGVGKG